MTSQYYYFFIQRKEIGTMEINTTEYRYNETAPITSGFHFKEHYSSHNELEAEFNRRFNSIGNKNLLMLRNEDETFRGDGCFVLVDMGKAMCYDWETRQSYFEDINFPFPNTRQYAQKIDREYIKISIQMSTNGNSIIVAFHEDFKPETKTTVSMRSNRVNNRKQTVYETELFEQYDIYDDRELLAFKEMINRALVFEIYDSRVF
jgi:hypothetical protein